MATGCLFKLLYPPPFGKHNVELYEKIYHLERLVLDLLHIGVAWNKESNKLLLVSPAYVYFS